MINIEILRKNMIKLGEFENTEIQLAVIDGIIDLYDGVTFLQEWNLNKIKINSDRTGVDLWFELNNEIAYRAIEL
jgi:hypothetical protein